MSIEDAIKNLDIMLDSAQRRTRRNIVIPDLIEAIEMAIEALKEKTEEREHMIKWFAKFCRHIDMPEHLSDEEAEILWREKMKQQFGWKSRKEESE